MRLLREPLIHFVALGAVLFLVYAVVSGVFSSDASRRIEMTESEIQLLAETWQRQWQRPPTEAELQGLVQARVREEALLRLLVERRPVALVAFPKWYPRILHALEPRLELLEEIRVARNITSGGDHLVAYRIRWDSPGPRAP